jgi:hypothetical protein
MGHHDKSQKCFLERCGIGIFRNAEDLDMSLFKCGIKKLPEL